MIKCLGKAVFYVAIFSLNAAHSSEIAHMHDEDNGFEEHAAHEHGYATAQITFVDDILIFDLSLPSMNVFGFEHSAKNKEQERVISQSKSILENSDKIIIIQPNNSCELTSMNIESDSINSLSIDTHEHHEHHEHHDEHISEVHSDVSIKYEYLCSEGNPNSINYTIFNSFPTIEEIEIQYISNNSQKIFSVTPLEHIQLID